MTGSGGDAASLVVWLLLVWVVSWGIAPEVRDWMQRRNRENDRT